MILIITHKEDYTADFVIEKLNSKHIPYFRFNCEDCLSYDISFQYGKKSGIVINGNNTFTSVWFRRTKLPELMHSDESERQYLVAEVDVFIRNLFILIKAKWLSYPEAIERAENKLLQLTVAAGVGFKIPETLVTANKEKLKQFIAGNKKTIIKPISTSRIEYTDGSSKLIFTNILEPQHVENLDKVSLTPAIFQEYIDREIELRVTVVGDEIFAACADPEYGEQSKVDWRRTKIKFIPYNLPAEIISKCLKVLSELNLKFGAFDLIKGKDGYFYFLEVNPNGQWVWIEQETGLPIADEIINFLTC